MGFDLEKCKQDGGKCVVVNANGYRHPARLICDDRAGRKRLVVLSMHEDEETVRFLMNWVIQIALIFI